MFTASRRNCSAPFLFEETTRSGKKFLPLSARSQAGAADFFLLMGLPPESPTKAPSWSVAQISVVSFLSFEMYLVHGYPRMSCFSPVSSKEAS